MYLRNMLHREICISNTEFKENKSSWHRVIDSGLKIESNVNVDF